MNIQFSFFSPFSFFFFPQTDAKRKVAEEEDNFTKEVTEFTNEYGLTSNRDLLIKKKVKTEINDLEKEAALLKNGKSYIKLFYLGLPENEYESVKQSF